MQKIMFNDRYGLTTAVLEGRKTMTRRIIPEMLDRKGIVTTVMDDDRKIKSYAYVGEPNREMDGVAEWMKLVPRYDVGEVIAIAQKYSQIFTKADLSKRKGGLGDMITGKAWDNKMFVQAAVMPHRIRITDIKLEHLQDIAEEDCMREGIEWCHGSQSYYVNYIPETGFRCWLRGKTAREAFAFLIDKVSGRGTWESNPFVWVYSFDLIK